MYCTQINNHQFNHVQGFAGNMKNKFIHIMYKIAIYNGQRFKKKKINYIFMGSLLAGGE